MGQTATIIYSGCAPVRTAVCLYCTNSTFAADCAHVTQSTELIVGSHPFAGIPEGIL